MSSDFIQYSFPNLHDGELSTWALSFETINSITGSSKQTALQKLWLLFVH